MSRGVNDERDTKTESAGRAAGPPLPGKDLSGVLEELPTPLRPFFAPVLKLAFGVAVGVPFAVLFTVLAAYNTAFKPPGFDFVWMSGQEFFPGYGPNALGIVLGIPWGFAVGFLAGWFLAFSRNLVNSIWIFIVGARQRLTEGVSAFDDM